MSESGSGSNGQDALASLRERMIEHAHFLRGRGGAPMELREQDFARLFIERFRFDRAVFRDCAFSFSSFANTSFIEAKLDNTSFAHCNMTGCDFSKAEMRGIGITHSNMASSRLRQTLGAEEYATFGADGVYTVRLQRGPQRPVVSDFSRSNFAGADLTEARLKGARLTEVNLAGANLGKADLEGVDLSGANLVGANFTGANIKGARFEGAIFGLDDKTRAVFAGNRDFEAFARAQEGVLEALRQHEAWAISNGMEGAKAYFRGETIRGVDFRYRTLAAIDFANAHLKGCLLTEAVLAASDFTGARLSYCALDRIDGRGVRFDRARFEFSTLVGADFGDLRLRHRDRTIPATFRGARFDHCDLRGARLSPHQAASAKFVECLRDADPDAETAGPADGAGGDGSITKS